MKFAAFALLFGITHAEQQIEDDPLQEMLKISISKHGERVIEKEARDVGQVWKKIQNSRPVRNLESSLKRWASSKEAIAIKHLDKKFLASKRGKRLIAEWKDVGRVIKKNLKKTKNGIHFPNSKIDDLSDELDDVADQYKALGKSKWAKRYDNAWRKALSNKQAKSVGRRAKKFKHSAQGKALKKELHDLKMAIKKHLKVSDLPKKLDDEENDLNLVSFDDEESDRCQYALKVCKAGNNAYCNWYKSNCHLAELDDEENDSFDDEENDNLSLLGFDDEENDVADLLKISISKKGQKEIEKEARDVKMTWHKIKNSQAVRNVENSLKRWADSNEINQIQALDRKFLASKEGKRLVAEWKDFGRALKKAIKETKNGIKIDNEELKSVQDEADDVAQQYKQLEGGKWDKAYHAAWKKALENKEAKSVYRRLDKFDKSKEGDALDKELEDLKRSLKKNVKVTDLPKKKFDDEENDIEEVEADNLVAMVLPDDEENDAVTMTKIELDDEENDSEAMLANIHKMSSEKLDDEENDFMKLDDEENDIDLPFM